MRRGQSFRIAIATVAVLVASVAGVAGGAGAAVADPTQSASITISPATQTHPTGAPQTYNIALSCQGTGASECGPDATITIPLDTTTTPSMTDPSWTYSATSGVTGLIASGPTVVGDDLVITLNDADFIGGFSGTISLKATPPNKVTPNGTSWSMAPTLTGGSIASTPAPTAAASTATASPLPAVTKSTANGGSVYEAGSDVSYTISATCSTASTGNLQFESGSLTDPIPAGMTYVSSTPTATVNGGVVTWDFPDAASTPAGCAPGATGTNTYQVVLTAPTPAPTGSITNTATFSGTGADANVPAGISKSTTATVPVAIVDGPPSGTGPGYASISKSSLAPLAQPGVTGNQYVGTYPGEWLTPKTSPSYTVGAAAASFQVTVNYGLVDTYQTDLLDPLPCLDDATGNVFASAAYDAAPCADPAFHPTVIQVASAGSDSPNNGLGAAIASGWRPQVLLTDGTTTVPLGPTGTVAAGASSAYFTIPAGNVGSVATIELPPNAALMNRSLQLTMWGYADQSLAGLNDSLNRLHNVATAIPQLNGTSLSPVQQSADLFTVPENVQLGISKSFGATGAGAGGTTVVNIKGAISFPTPQPPHDVVLTDLLPTGLTWANPAATGSFTLSQGAGQTTIQTSATVQDLANYQGSGRELIRMTIPATAFSVGGAGGAGSWTITPPANFIRVNTPTALGIYTNTDQIFLAGLGAQQIDPACTTPTQTGGGTTTATFESDNEMDLAGDGITNEDYCQNAASLSITGTGAAFALTKTVQGDLDTVARGALGIGTASEGGSGTYVLKWTNVGSDNLNDAVVYDILPYVGDKGVSQGQAGVARDSAFAPVFTGIGALPAGVSVQYSESSNPCRPEVFPNADNTACVDDWGPAPSDLSTVKALRFTGAPTTPYVAGSGFAVNVNVAVPAGVVNKVAWNSAATNATDVSDPSAVTLPAEPPKVGLVAPSTPTIVTSTSAATVPPHTGISDSVTIAGTGGNPGSLAWRLVGPVAPVNGACTNADWTGAPVVDSGTTATTGDGTVTTGPVTVAAVGCYSWTDALTPTTAGAFPTPPAIAAGADHEVTQLSLFDPALTTKAASTTSGDETVVHDVITIAGSGLRATPDSPTQASLDWTLHGPVAPIRGSCATVSWAGAPTADHGTLTVTEDGDVSTPDTILTAAGCYSFSESLAATADSRAASTDPGVAAETILIPAAVIGGLAFTGTNVAGLVGLAVLLLLAGAIAFVARRRRWA